MENRSLDITVTSAKGLKKVSKMDVFVAVKLSGDPKCSDHREQRTQVAKDSGTSPRWSDDVLKFSIDHTLAQASRLVITFKIRCEQRGGDDKDIGEVHVQVKELLDHLGKDEKGQRYVTYKIKNPNGKPGGDISFNYSFGGLVVVNTNAGGCTRYLAHETLRPAHETTVCPTHVTVLPAATYQPVSNRPVLSQLLPSVGSFSYGPSQPPIYPAVAQPEFLPPTIFPGLYTPHGYIPECSTTMYPTVAPSIFPGLSCPPPAGYPTLVPPHTQSGLYPPMTPYGF